ncbi:hypothetical protein SAMN04489760_10826 [Syntrophus gentianae]|uniref:Uncharacterized protein n=1 Tax=Syntrophus gentianae TaxID=43775 RepID=A0A1H7WV06_9BACT|nr:hypothetical protein [Syntrophus gentianae]SEM25372.1 hypothetical protein SAMN04489760_10826 [Syntrophus gentianae]
MVEQNNIIKKTKNSRTRRKRRLASNTSILGEVTIYLRTYNGTDRKLTSEEAAMLAEVIKRFNEGNYS